ncbi:unnamed protein product [Notodromas monacha]|uniref:26S proteasome non-ATPase regulatory subunit 1 n=1 Tax=Notodromas monacha TaxID=399045 RepID=A0A7R9GEJ0_9CRUS|nr:unnamed protein product [Notodromas monacha]CAG0919675.1 unnamed protein product [Notodromas monacha]
MDVSNIPSYVTIPAGIALTLFAVRKFRERSWGWCKSVRDMSGKCVLVTGASSGLGEATVVELAQRNARVIMACRDEAKARAAVERIRKLTKSGDLIAMHVDMKSLGSVVEFAKKVKQDNENAPGVEPRTEDGLEILFGVNHLAHFVLVKELLPLLMEESAPSRVVVMASSLYASGKAMFDAEKLESSVRRPKLRNSLYCDSKMANVLFMRELARRLEATSVNAYAVCPGWCNTNLFRHSNYSIVKKLMLAPILFWFMRSAKQGCQTIVHCTTEESLGNDSGKMFKDVKEYPLIPYAMDEKLARDFWDYTDQLAKDLLKKHVDYMNASCDDSAIANVNDSLQLTSQDLRRTVLVLICVVYCRKTFMVLLSLGENRISFVLLVCANLVAEMHVTSAAGILAWLDEPVPELQVFTLQKLNEVVDEFWAEISEHIEKIEVLYEDKNFSHRNLAALVASKVFYHLGSYQDSLYFALGAAGLFDVNSSSQYVTTIVAKCIDHYTKLRLVKIAKEKKALGKAFDDGNFVITGQPELIPSESVMLTLSGLDGGRKMDAISRPMNPNEPVDPRLEQIVDRMFQRCFDHGQFKQALGIALETRRMDVFEKSILSSDDVLGMLSYAFKVTMSLIDERQFRNEVLRTLVNLYRSLPGNPDYVSMSQCLIFLDDPEAVAELLLKILSGASEDSEVMAYQLAFDLYESATQQFLGKVLDALRTMSNITFKIPTSHSTVEKAEEKVEAKIEEKMDTDEANVEDGAEPKPPAVKSQADTVLDDAEKVKKTKLEKLATILCGDVPISLYLQFLIKSNHTDMMILKNTKDQVRVSVCHTATVVANGFMHCGTTSDQFLRDNLDWLSRANNWARFSATASLGVIHKGHEKDALALMQAYLPKESGGGGGGTSASASGYSEGGGLYALGLIHANHGAAITKYLQESLTTSTSPFVRHGGCLGLGLAAMGSQRLDILELLKEQLFQDDAVTGEAAGIAMGLVMLGSNDGDVVHEMITYAQETQHEKILRGLAIGLAMIVYGRLEDAEPVIVKLTTDKDPILRRSGMYSIAMAYAGTGNNGAIKRLLHVAVSDVNEDVRRAAVESLGFLLFRTPDQMPSVVSLLAESYNPHVRYGAAMALGIACAGTGLQSAITLLDPLTNDQVNYVRQGALVASALVLIQQSETSNPKVKEMRNTYSKVLSDKHEDVMAKFGAILAQGIIDAGGRNMTVSLQSRTGHMHMMSVVGMLVFTQFWYWFPLSHFLSLAFTPTTIIGVTAELKMPKVQIRSAAKPSLYAYPAPLQEKKKEEREKVTTAVLSITAKQNRRRRNLADFMEVDKEERKEKEEKEKEKKEREKKEEEEREKKKKEDEPHFEILENPARVLKPQLNVVSLEGSRYKPVKDISQGGFVVLTDNSPKDPQDLVEPVAAMGPQLEPEGDEPPPPQPFHYPDD